MAESVNGGPPAEDLSASATPSPDAQSTPSPEELTRLRAKLDLVTEDKRRAGEKNAQLNQRLQELEESLRATQAQLKDGKTQQLASSGEYKQLWEDAKATNIELERRIAEMQSELDAERQARNTESLRTRAIQAITAAQALRPDQLLSLIAPDLREADGKPAVIQGGIEIPLSDYLARLRSPESGWDHHFAPTGSKGMGAPASPGLTPAAPSGSNPFLMSPPNLTEIARLYREDRAAHDRLKAEASRG